MTNINKKVFDKIVGTAMYGEKSEILDVFRQYQSTEDSEFKRWCLLLCGHLARRFNYINDEISRFVIESLHDQVEAVRIVAEHTRDDILHFTSKNLK